jgi:hypothetical protein
MFIDLTHDARTSSVRRSGMQPELHHSESFRSSERSRSGSCFSSYKHVTPNRGKTHCLSKKGAGTTLKGTIKTNYWNGDDCLSNLGGDRVHLSNL